jgi:hypothetical protein
MIDRIFTSPVDLPKEKQQLTQEKRLLKQDRMKGFKKRLVVLSIIFVTLYLTPVGGYAQDSPTYDPGFIDQPTNNNQATDQQTDQPSGDDIFKDEQARTPDSLNVGLVNINLGGGFKGAGGGPYSSTSGGPSPSDPGQDPDAPIDDGLLLLLGAGFAYGFWRLYLNRKVELSRLPISSTPPFLP